jgi:hypothetical protein
LRRSTNGGRARGWRAGAELGADALEDGVARGRSSGPARGGGAT